MLAYLFAAFAAVTIATGPTSNTDSKMQTPVVTTYSAEDNTPAAGIERASNRVQTAINAGASKASVAALNNNLDALFDQRDGKAVDTSITARIARASNNVQIAIYEGKDKSLVAIENSKLDALFAERDNN